MATVGAAHAAVYAEHPGAVAVCDVDGTRAAALARAHGIPEVYTDHRPMLARCECDAVACAEPGKHLLLERPLATTRDEVFRSVEVIERHGVRAMVDFHSR